MDLFAFLSQLFRIGMLMIWINGAPSQQEVVDPINDLDSDTLLQSRKMQKQMIMEQFQRERAATKLNPFFLDVIGDTVWSKKMMSHQTSYSSRVKRGYLNPAALPGNIWTDMPIKYSYSSTLDSDIVAAFVDATNIISEYTCIQFQYVADTSDLVAKNISHVSLRASSSCVSVLGRSSLLIPQPLYIDQFCQIEIYQLVHEVFQTLAIYHEQQRPDRDGFINVTIDNVQDNEEGQYLKIPSQYIESYGLPYDLGSLMHFDTTTSAKNGRKTFYTVDPCFANTPGQRTEMSFLDLKLLNYGYCNNSCSGTAPNCQNSGYRNPKECNECICPDGFAPPLCEDIAPSKPTAGLCGGDITVDDLDTHSIQTPNYNTGDYNVGTECTWKIKPKSSGRIEYYFDDMFGVFKKEKTCYHWVEIRGGLDMDTNGYRFCGYTPSSGEPGDTSCLLSENNKALTTSDTLMVIFKANYPRYNGYTLTGFKIYYRIVTNNPCEYINCVNGVCVGGVCQCDQGWSGELCDQSNDACTSNPMYCMNGATCVDVNGSPTCNCVLGYAGTRCNINVNECLSRPCQNGGTCNDGLNGYTCTCVNGYFGTHCEFTQGSGCDPNPCKNGGECVPLGGGQFRCDCADGYTGDDCSTIEDNCEPDSCVNGECKNGVNTYTCDCDTGYDGDRCQNNIDDCRPTSCLNGGECIDQVNSFRCQCPANTIGDYCQTINYCYNNPCKNGATCINLSNGVRCDCTDDYEGTYCDTPKPIEDPCNCNLAIGSSQLACGVTIASCTKRRTVRYYVRTCAWWICTTKARYRYEYYSDTCSYGNDGYCCRSKSHIKLYERSGVGPSCGAEGWTSWSSSCDCCYGHTGLRKRSYYTVYENQMARTSAESKPCSDGC